MKIGIIGTNFVSDNMVEASRITQQYTLSVVCSRNIDNAESFAMKHDIPHFTDNYKDFLNYDLNAVYIAVPNALHKDIALFFIEHKIAVLCEKPLASNYDEVSTLIEASRRNQTLLMEATVPIYTKGFETLKENLSQIGNVRSAILAMNQYSSRYDAYRQGTVLNAFKPELSNGSLMDIGIYPLSVALALFGKPNDFFASGFVLDSKVDGSGTLVLMYDDKDIIITHSKISNQKLIPEIEGEDGTLQINHISLLNEITLTKNKQKSEILYSDYETPSMVYELKKFAQAYEEKQTEVFLGAHQLSLDVHEIMTEIRKRIDVTFPADKN